MYIAIHWRVGKVEVTIWGRRVSAWYLWRVHEGTLVMRSARKDEKAAILGMWKARGYNNKLLQECNRK